MVQASAWRRQHSGPRSQKVLCCWWARVQARSPTTSEHQLPEGKDPRVLFRIAVLDAEWLLNQCFVKWHARDFNTGKNTAPRASQAEGRVTGKDTDSCNTM